MTFFYEVYKYDNVVILVDNGENWDSFLCRKEDWNKKKKKTGKSASDSLSTTAVPRLHRLLVL